MATKRHNPGRGRYRAEDQRIGEWAVVTLGDSGHSATPQHEPTFFNEETTDCIGDLATNALKCREAFLLRRRGRIHKAPVTDVPDTGEPDTSLWPNRRMVITAQ